MAEITPNVETIPFPDTQGATPVRCSTATCLAGHTWPPALLAVKCPADGSPVVAVQKSNCPVCNEPIAKVVIRVDFVPRGAGIVARCAGQQVAGESIDIELVPSEWQEIVSGTRDTRDFESRRSAERVGIGNDK